MANETFAVLGERDVERRGLCAFRFSEDLPGKKENNVNCMTEQEGRRGTYHTW